MTTKFFDSIIILSFGKTKEAKTKFIVQKKKKKNEMLIFVISLSQN